MTDRPHPSLDEVRAMLVELTTITSMMHSRADEALAPLEQNLLRYQILSHYAGGPVTVSQVARNLHVSRQYVQRVTNDLRAAGRVSAHENPAHRRSPLFTATESGIDEDRAAMDAVTPWVAFLSETLENEQLTRLRESLQLLGAAARSFDSGDGADEDDQTP